MTEPRTDSPPTSDGTTGQSTERQDTDRPPYAHTEVETAHESPPGTPRWVKAFGIILVVLLLAFAGLHLTGDAPTHMPGSGDAQHGTQAP